MTAKFPQLLALFAIVTISATTIFYLAPAAPPLSPLSGNSVLETPDPDNAYIILGFIPYWNLKKFTPSAANTITSAAYFNLLLDEAGNLVKQQNPREEEPGYTNYKRILADSVCLYLDTPTCPPLTLTFVQASQDSLISLLSSPAARERAVNTILTELQRSQAVGVNIDFEPLGEISPSLRNSFTVFMTELAATLQSTPSSPYTLSLSVYPSAASRPRLWDLASLEPVTDLLVVMTYDYTLPTDIKTGPNSPLRGAGTLLEHDIIKNIAEISTYFPPRKILLGIPFYGYEWDTTDSAKYTPTSSRGAVASLERIQTLLDEQVLELLWDRNTLTPYALRRDQAGEIISQIYYEDANSISLKLELVKEVGLGGIAIWAVGYEGQHSKLWEAIDSGLHQR